MEEVKKKSTINDGMTEEERMAKYNLKNYPNKKIRYGNGNGAISPYPKNDKRSEAYYDREIKKAT